MTSIIDDKIYELITKSENFEFAYDIRQRFDEIQNRIWIEFWADFQYNLKNEYCNFYIKEVAENEWAFDFYDKKWKKARFYFNIDDNYLQYGIELDFVGNKKQFQQIRGFLSEIFINEEISEKNDKIWYYNNCDEKFETAHNLKMILPENRSKIISDYVSVFVRFAEKVIIEINNFEENISK